MSDLKKTETIFFNAPITKEEAQEVLAMAGITEELNPNKLGAYTWFYLEIDMSALPALNTALLISNMYRSSASRLCFDIHRK
jgi:hypothetical protein